MWVGRWPGFDVRIVVLMSFRCSESARSLTYTQSDQWSFPAAQSLVPRTDHIRRNIFTKKLPEDVETAFYLTHRTFEHRSENRIWIR